MISFCVFPLMWTFKCEWNHFVLHNPCCFPYSYEYECRAFISRRKIQHILFPCNAFLCRSLPFTEATDTETHWKSGIEVDKSSDLVGELSALTIITPLWATKAKNLAALQCNGSCCLTTTSPPDFYTLQITLKVFLWKRKSFDKFRRYKSREKMFHQQESQSSDKCR